MNRNRPTKFVRRPYRDNRVRRQREADAQKIFDRRKKIAKKKEKQRKERLEREGIVPPAFAKLGVEIAGISTTDTGNVS